MAQTQIWTKLSSNMQEIARGLGRGCIRAVAVVAIVGTYGLAQTVGVVGLSGIAMTASTTQAKAWRGRGWGWGRGRGWGWGRGRGWCYWHPYAC